jgi:hypothetical protein
VKTVLALSSKLTPTADLTCFPHKYAVYFYPNLWGNSFCYRENFMIDRFWAMAKFNSQLSAIAKQFFQDPR